jgi:ribosome-binding protein aMBF1 (putative translation factor)
MTGQEELTDWDDLRKAKLESFSDAERAAYEDKVKDAEIRSEMAQLVYDMRTQAGLTQTELGRRAATQQSYVSAVEHGARTPTLETLNRMAAATGHRLKLTLEPA